MRNGKWISREMFPVIWALAWPTVVEQFLHTAVQYVDTAMVGSLGTRATAAVGATSTVNWLVGSTISALGVGFLAFISQSLGQDNRDKARRAVRQAVLCAGIVGVVFTLFTTLLSSYVPLWMQVDADIRGLTGQYFLILYSPMLFRTASILFGTVLRAAGDTKTPMRVGLLVNLINVILNFLLIFPCRSVNVFSWTLWIPGAGLGVIGAAVASAIGFAVGGILMTIVLWRHPMISPRGGSFRPDMSILKPCLRVALPNALQRFGTSFGYVAFASLINSVGNMATAAHTIANTVESAFYVPGYGMQAAAATLAGNAYGAGDSDKIHKLGRSFLLIELLLMLASGGLLFAFAPRLMDIFSDDVQVILLGTIVLRMVAVSEPFYGMSIVIEGMMQGMGRTMVPLVCNIFGMWVVRILGTYICVHFFGFGLVAAWACMIGHNLFLFLLFVFYYFSNGWDKGIKKKS
jgi:putative MATE family efflux protein